MMKNKEDPFFGIDCAKDMSSKDKEELLKEAYKTLDVEEIEPSILLICGSDITSFILFVLLFYAVFSFLFRIVTKSFL